MKSRAHLALVACLMMGSAFGAAPSVLSDNGYGAITIGMSRDDAVKAMGAGWKYEAFPDGGQDISNDVCGFISKDGGEISIMLEGGKVVRVEAGSPAVLTDKGIHIGSTEADIRKAYGDSVVATPHQYEEAPAQYLTVWTKGKPATPDGEAAPDARGIEFVTDKSRTVTEIFGGGPAIQYVEGCA